jgi:leucyl aminopeptidase
MKTTPLEIILETDLEAAVTANPWLKTTDFKATPHSFCLVPDANGEIKKVVVGGGKAIDLWTLGSLPQKLPQGDYALQGIYTSEQATTLALGWALGRYQFSRYRKKPKTFPTLVMPANADATLVESTQAATFLARDLINTPANDMMPADLSRVATSIAATFDASIAVHTDIEHAFPLVWAVGKGSENKPCVIDMHWGDAKNPKITLVGKGVCFDSGGLDIKPAGAMKLMKKDMGGAAIVLGLAQLIMAMRLPVRLRVIIPAVENSVSGSAFRPLDIIKSRKGLTVEIGDTDAEGRLILADALDLAAEDKPALVVDFATLTGAARVALGAEIPAVLSNTPALAEKIVGLSQTQQDPLWQLPLYDGYRAQLDSKVADLNNVSSSGYGGAITAGLFLKEFVPESIRWVHIDCMAWNMSTQSGRPEGGEAMGLRTLFALLSQGEWQHG